MNSDLPVELLAVAQQRVKAICSSNLTIYDSVLAEGADLRFTDDELQELLLVRLVGRDLSAPIRTRSKIVKQMVAAALGYQPPLTFAKTRPRFPGQDLDVYVQTSDNLQIWNETVAPERRYVLVRPDATGVIRSVRVVRGQQIARWDRTGTLTSKFQAKRASGRSGSTLVSGVDTDHMIKTFEPGPVSAEVLSAQSSGERPVPGAVLPIAEIYQRVLGLVESKLPAAGAEQDRVRGEFLQEAVTLALGLASHDNHGRWPDFVSQALEVKLQTSPTIDLGLILPTDPGMAPALGPTIRHCDARYLVAYGVNDSAGATTITEVVVTTGTDFFNEFVQFGGLVKNTKIQIRLPPDLFDA